MMLCVLIFQDPTVITTIGELLHAAVAEGRPKKVEALLCQGAKVDFKDKVSSVKEIEKTFTVVASPLLTRGYATH